MAPNSHLSHVSYYVMTYEWPSCPGGAGDDHGTIALKAALYEAFREAGRSQRRLARELDVAESEVWRMLNPDHATKAAIRGTRTFKRAAYRSAH